MLKTNKLLSNKWALLTAMAIVFGTNTTIAIADERESLEQLKATTSNLVELLVQEGVLSKDKAEAMTKKASQDAARQVKQAKAKDEQLEADTQKDEQSIRVQYVPEHVKNQIREEVKKDVMEKLNYKADERLAMPTWIDRFAFNGDIRLRFENDSFSSKNASTVALNNDDRNAKLSNSTENRDRLRLRARLGADVKVNDWLSGGLRLTTGLIEDPISPNQTEEIGKGKYTLGLDRAFLAASPLPWLSIKGGRFANPFVHTDLIWDPDLAFDGGVAIFKPTINDRWSSVTTIGAFPIESVQASEIEKAKDKWLYALQTGIKWQAENKTSAQLAVAYYDYRNVEGAMNPLGFTNANATVPAFRQRGNNTFNVNKGNLGLTPTPTTYYALASKFELLNIMGQVDLMNFDPVHVTLTGDYVKNIGFDKSEVLQRTGTPFAEETDGYQLRLDVGHNSFSGPASTDIHAKDWQFSLAYKYLEADATLDAFTDSDFHLGGTDAKGWILSGNYAIDKNAWISARYYSADSITGIPFSNDVFLLDFNAKF